MRQKRHARLIYIGQNRKMSTCAFSFHECQLLFDNSLHIRVLLMNATITFPSKLMCSNVSTQKCAQQAVCCECKLRLQEIPAASRHKGGSAGLPGNGWHFVKVTCAWMLHLLQPEVAAGPSWILTFVNVLVQSGQPVFVGTNHWFCHCE